MTHDDVQAWLDRYVDAWRTYDPAVIGDLFTEGAEYRYHPWDEPIVRPCRDRPCLGCAGGQRERARRAGHLGCPV